MVSSNYVMFQHAVFAMVISKSVGIKSKIRLVSMNWQHTVLIRISPPRTDFHRFRCSHNYDHTPFFHSSGRNCVRKSAFLPISTPPTRLRGKFIYNTGILGAWLCPICHTGNSDLQSVCQRSIEFCAINPLLWISVLPSFVTTICSSTLFVESH